MPDINVLAPKAPIIIISTSLIDLNYSNYITYYTPVNRASLEI